MTLETEVLLACKGAIAHIDEVVADFANYEKKVMGSKKLKNPKNAAIIDNIVRCHGKLEEGIGLLDIYKLLIEDITNHLNAADSQSQNLQEILSEFDTGLNSQNRGFHSYLRGLSEFQNEAKDPYVAEFSNKIMTTHSILIGLSSFLKTRYENKQIVRRSGKTQISIGVYVADQKLFEIIKKTAHSFLEKVRPGIEIRYEELTDNESIKEYLASNPSKNIFFIYGLGVIGKDTPNPVYIPMPTGRELLTQFEKDYEQQIADKSVRRLVFRPFTKEKSVGLAYNDALARTMGTTHLMKEDILVIKDEQMSHSFNRYLLRIISDAYIAGK